MRKSVMSVVLVCAAVGLLTGQALSGRSERGADDIYIAPHTLVLSSDVISVTVHTNIGLGAVDRATVALSNEAGESIPATLTYADSRGNLVAKFAIGAVKTIVSPGSVTLTLTATLKKPDPITGEDLFFEGSDTITVKE